MWGRGGGGVRMPRPVRPLSFSSPRHLPRVPLLLRLLLTMERYKGTSPSCGTRTGMACAWAPAYGDDDDQETTTMMMVTTVMMMVVMGGWWMLQVPTICC